MVTNLSSFPSALTVIPVPDGDIKKHRQSFIVNEDLKRLGCSGRSGMSLSEPTKATQDKFLSLYKTSDRVPFSEAVLELVKICQVALFIFGKLEPEYIDGLLCDVTEKAINDWWTEVGSEYFNIEPTDGILGPTTVAALLGTLMGARNRLSWYGAPIAKDVFDLDSTKRGIGSFQKAYKLERTRRLDHRTLQKLHSVTAKAAAGEAGWGVQKAVKSTVEGFGGKRGEIVIGLVGGKEKANIGDIETYDMDKFIGLLHGERAKWLWYGKPRRSIAEHHEKSIPEMGNILFGKEELAGQPNRRVQSMPLDEELETRKEKESTSSIYSAPVLTGSALSVAESPGDKDALRKGVLKSVAGKVSDARSGFGRFRDAVGGGLRGHASRPSRDDTPATGFSSPSIASLAQSSGALTSPVMVGRAFTWKNKPEEYVNGFRKEDVEPASLTSSAMRSSDQAAKESKSLLQGIDEADMDHDAEVTNDQANSTLVDGIRALVTEEVSAAGSMVDEADLRGPILALQRDSSTTLTGLQRRHSDRLPPAAVAGDIGEARWPRRLSFSVAEDAVLGWEDIAAIEEPNQSDVADALMQHVGSAEVARNFYTQLADLKQSLEPWVSSNVRHLESLDDLYEKQAEDLQNLYYQLTEAYQHVKHNSSELVGSERARITEALREVEVLAQRLEYEIGALASKVQDVEDGVAQFEAQVEYVEQRAEELKAQLETESWLHWAVRTLTGIGTGPNITRGPVAPAKSTG